MAHPVGGHGADAERPALPFFGAGGVGLDAGVGERAPHEHGPQDALPAAPLDVDLVPAVAGRPDGQALRADGAVLVDLCTERGLPGCQARTLAPGPARV